MIRLTLSEMQTIATCVLAFLLITAIGCDEESLDNVHFNVAHATEKTYPRCCDELPPIPCAAIDEFDLDWPCPCVAPGLVGVPPAPALDPPQLLLIQEVN